MNPESGRRRKRASAWLQSEPWKAPRLRCARVPGMTGVGALVDRAFRRPSLAADLETGSTAFAAVLARAAVETHGWA